MKSTLALLLFLALPGFADEIVFRGLPSLRVISSTDHDERKQLDGDAARDAESVIVQRGKNKYFWQSRNNAPMMRVDTPGFTYFIHTGGLGYVKVLTGERKATNAPADYIESFTRGFDVITYWGRVAIGASQ